MFIYGKQGVATPCFQYIGYFSHVFPVNKHRTIIILHLSDKFVIIIYMSKFKDIFEKANIIDLKNYLLKMKKPCYESDLLKISFNNIKITDLTPLDLYQHHFVLFNILYNFQNELTKENKYLYIHFMRTYLLEYPEKGK